MSSKGNRRHTAVSKAASKEHEKHTVASAKNEEKIRIFETEAIEAHHKRLAQQFDTYLHDILHIQGWTLDQDHNQSTESEIPSKFEVAREVERDKIHILGFWHVVNGLLRLVETETPSIEMLSRHKEDIGYASGHLEALHPETAFSLKKGSAHGYVSDERVITMQHLQIWTRFAQRRLLGGDGKNESSDNEHVQLMTPDDNLIIEWLRIMVAGADVNDMTYDSMIKLEENAQKRYAKQLDLMDANTPFSTLRLTLILPVEATIFGIEKHIEQCILSMKRLIYAVGKTTPGLNALSKRLDSALLELSKKQVTTTVSHVIVRRKLATRWDPDPGS